MAEFPGAIPTNRQSSTSEYLSNMANNFGHVALHNFEVNEIVALATKLGTGASTPSAGTVLRGTGSGASAYGALDLSTDVTGLLAAANLAAFSSATLRGLLTDETGAGAAVFANSPTLITPTIASLINATHNHENAAGGGQLDGDALIAGSVSNSHLNTATGELGGPWQTWTPVWTNLAVGNGTVSAAYTNVGKTILGRLSLVFGSTTSISGVVQVTLPVPPRSIALETPIGICRPLDSGVAGYNGAVLMWDLTIPGRVLPTVYNTSGTHATDNAIQATTPFTWATADTLLMSFAYEAA